MFLFWSATLGTVLFKCAAHVQTFSPEKIFTVLQTTSDRNSCQGCSDTDTSIRKMPPIRVLSFLFLLETGPCRFPAASSTPVCSLTGRKLKTKCLENVSSSCVRIEKREKLKRTSKPLPLLHFHTPGRSLLERLIFFFLFTRLLFISSHTPAAQALRCSRITV